MLSAVCFAYFLSVVAESLKAGIFDHLVRHVVRFNSGYAQMQLKGYWENQTLDNSFHLNDSIKNRILSVPGVTGIAPRLQSFMLISSGERTVGCLLLGIDKLGENRVLSFSEKIMVGKAMEPGEKGVVVAEGLMHRLRARLGDTVVFLGQGYHASLSAGAYPILGIVRMGAPDLDRTHVFMDIHTCAELLDAKNRTTAWVIGIQKPTQLTRLTDSVKKHIPTDWEVLTWKQMMPALEQHIRTDSRNLFFIQALIYVLIGFGIYGALRMMIHERKKELAMLLSIGMSKINIVCLIVIENLATIILGILVGVLIAGPVVYALSLFPIQIGGEAADAYRRFGFEPIFPALYDADIFIRQTILVVLLAVVVSAMSLKSLFALNPLMNKK